MERIKKAKNIQRKKNGKEHYALSSAQVQGKKKK